MGDGHVVIMPEDKPLTAEGQGNGTGVGGPGICTVGMGAQCSNSERAPTTAEDTGHRSTAQETDAVRGSSWHDPFDPEATQCSEAGLEDYPSEPAGACMGPWDCPPEWEL